MTENCGQITIRSRLGDATKDELLEIIVSRNSNKANWFDQYFAANHRIQRLESLLASRYHNEHELNRALHVADLEAANKKLRLEIRMMQEAAERHNRESYATGLIVNCTGCDAGGPFNADELTEERVRTVEQIATRLRTWWNNHCYRVKEASK